MKPLNPPAEAEIVHRLRAAGCVFAEDEAGLLIEAASTPVDLDAMVDQRVGGLPLEQILGWAEFRGLRIGDRARSLRAASSHRVPRRAGPCAGWPRARRRRPVLRFGCPRCGDSRGTGWRRVVCLGYRTCGCAVRRSKPRRLRAGLRRGSLRAAAGFVARAGRSAARQRALRTHRSGCSDAPGSARPRAAGRSRRWLRWARRRPTGGGRSTGMAGTGRSRALRDQRTPGARRGEDRAVRPA